MGLDIYVRWGTYNEETGDYEGFPEELHEDQLTGFKTAPEAGYLRESWGSLRWVSDFSRSIKAPDPYGFFPDWGGYNGEKLDVSSPEKLQPVLDYRDKVLRPWLRDIVNHYKQWVEEHGPNDFLGDEGEDKDWWDALHAFERRVRDVVSFINFVELHKHEPSLVIAFD